MVRARLSSRPGWRRGTPGRYGGDMGRYGEIWGALAQAGGAGRLDRDRDRGRGRGRGRASRAGVRVSARVMARFSPYISLYLPVSPYTCDLERRCSMVSVISALLSRYCSGTWRDVGRYGEIWGDVGRHGEMWGAHIDQTARRVGRRALGEAGGAWRGAREGEEWRRSL